MCGRFTVTNASGIAAELSLSVPVGELPAAPPGSPEEESIARSPLAVDPSLADLLRRPRYNIAPTQLAPVVLDRPAAWRFVEPLRWGLVPSWADDLSGGSKLINARAETVATARPFRDALRHRRCLVLADGFYEWKRDGKLRRPFYLRRPSHGLLAFAGLWERWRAPDGSWVRSFAIITTAASREVAGLHDRMPAILDAADWERWLAPAGEAPPPEALVALLRPAVDQTLEIVEVSSLVSSPKNELPACIEPIAPTAPTALTAPAQ